MKILIVTQYFYPENFRINDICLGLKERNHVVTVLTGKPNYPSGKFYKGYNFFNKNYEIWKGIKIYRTNLIPRGNGCAISLFLNYFSFAFLSSIRLLFIRSKFDKVFIFAPSPITIGFPGIVASKFFKAKVVLWVHDLWPESIRIAGGIESKWVINSLDLMTRWIYNNVDKILIQSEEFKSYIEKQVHDKDKIIYYPFYAEEFYKVEKPELSYIQQLPDGFKLLFAGNIGEGQSFPTLLEAAKIIKKLGLPISWIIFGDGRMKEIVEKEIEEHDLGKQFILKGTLPALEMPKYFSCVDGLLVSLKKSAIFSITIPGKLQSYLACGRPIIGSLDGIGAKIINESGCGFTAKAESVEELVEAIISLFNLTKEERISLGSNGRNYFEKEFEREMLLDKLENILHF
jgi:glycosyltransferase involved in cell wall biosynthesis